MPPVLPPSPAPKAAAAPPNACPSLGSRSGLLYVNVLRVQAPEARSRLTLPVTCGNGYCLRVCSDALEAPLQSMIAPVAEECAGELVGKALEYLGATPLTFELLC